MSIFDPSSVLSYGLFGLTTGLTLFFFLRSFKDGYWNSHSEDVKYQVFQDDPPKGHPHD
jgi:hypothetical protein